MEIIGKVQNDLSVRVMASTDLGPEGNIGMQAGSFVCSSDLLLFSFVCSCYGRFGDDMAKE